MGFGVRSTYGISDSMWWMQLSRAAFLLSALTTYQGECVTDALSPVGKVEYSAEAQKWIRLTPVDGIADSTVLFLTNRLDA